MNIPGLTERTLRRDFEKSGVTVNSDIQVNVFVLEIGLCNTNSVLFCLVKGLGCSCLSTPQLLVVG